MSNDPPRPVVAPPRIRKWRRVRTTHVAKFRVMDVCRLELEDADGRSRGEVVTLECRDWCNVVALTPEDAIVLVWQYRFGTDAMSLELPGGVVDPGETPEQAALRELREESGYEADSVEPLLVVEPNPAIQNNRAHTFVARGARRTGATKFDAQEELETVLLPLAKLEALLDSGQVTHGLIHGALATFSRHEQRRRAANDAERLTLDLEALQHKKVIDLARRLLPGLTLEDVRNPHDFPELSDPDWQYEDGILTGIQSVLMALRAQIRGAGR